MPRTKGPRLYLDPKRDQWIVRDGRDFIRTGCARADLGRAEKLLAEHIGRKHQTQSSPTPLIADVLNAYAREHVPQLRTAKNIGYNIGSLAKWWSAKRVTDINARSCRAYAATKTQAAAAQDLKVLKAALNYWNEEYGPLATLPQVWRPAEGAPRERWLTRSEAARLLKVARRVPYLARFILIGLYTGSRAGAVCTAALEPTEGKGWIDLDKGIFYRRPRGVRETKKRRPPVPLPRRLLAHLRRWKQAGQSFAVEWNGKGVKDCDKAFRNVAREAGFDDVSPHVLRHTAATWLMQLATDKWEVAEYLGMTAKVLDDVYGHHHPDHLKGPRDSFDRAPKARQRNAGTERETTATNVTKIAVFSK